MALAQLPKITERAKRILENNRATLNQFLEGREELEGARSESGTTCFPRLWNSRVEDLCTLLHEKYDTAVVPGSCFEMPEHFRIGMCAEPEFFREGVERLGAALDSMRR